MPSRSIGDGGAGEVEGAAVGGGDDFDGVGVGDVFGGAEDFEGGDVDVRVREGAEEGGDVFGVEEGFVALDVDVDVGGDGAAATAWTRSVPLGRSGEVSWTGPAVLRGRGRRLLRSRWRR